MSAVVAPDDSVIRVVAYARLSLFGPGAARLHDEIIAIAGPWSGGDDAALPVPGPGDCPEDHRDDPATRGPRREATEAKVEARIAPHASRLFSSLWPALEAEADARGIAAQNGLRQGARREASDLVKLLQRQKTAVDKQTKRMDLRARRHEDGPGAAAAARA